MTLELAKLLAKELGNGMVYQESRRYSHRGIQTAFYPKDYEMNDWHAVGVEVYSAVSK